jgi:hypothetical protein
VRRAALLLMVVMLLPATVAQAREKNARPRGDVAATAASEAGGGSAVEHLIRVDAVDPDGHITEIAIDFGDGVMVWLLLACDAENPPGVPVTQELTWSYAPGQYMVKAWAYSSPDCFSGPFQQSRTARAHIGVRK